MKTQIFTIVLLIITLASYAQSQRRGEQGRNNNSNNSNHQTSRSEGVTARSSAREYNNQPARTNDNISRRSSSDRATATQENNDQFRRATNSSDGSGSRSRNQSVVGSNNVSHEQPSKVSTHRSDDGRSWSSNDSRRDGSSSRAITSSSSRRGPADNYRTSTESRHHSVRFNRPHSSYHHAEIARYYHGPRHIHHEWYHRRPVNTHVCWTVNLHHDFRIFYPEVRVWRYPVGYRILSIPAYEAYDYVGEVANVYGKVVEVYYAYQNDEYYLYFGNYYPYHDFSVVVPGREAQLFSMRPERYFENSYITVTGYVTVDEDKPEIVVHRASQIEVY